MENARRFDIRRVAKLAMIGLSEEEEKKLQGELDAIMEFMEPLTRVDMPEVKPTIRPFSDGNAWREDDPQISFTREEMLANAPYTEDDEYIKVPQVLAEEGMMQ